MFWGGDVFIVCSVVILLVFLLMILSFDLDTFVLLIFMWNLFYKTFIISPSWRRSVLGVHWKVWCWSWNSNTLATWCEELTYWKRPWCWERLRAGGEGDDRGWDGWMASLTQWTWVWVNSWSWWWTGRPGVLCVCGVAKSRTRLSDWTELNELWFRVAILTS